MTNTTQQDTGIRKYLDAGSLNLFAHQLLNTLDGAIAVAVYDALGRLAWSGPDGADPTDLPEGPFETNPFEEDGSCLDLGAGHHAFLFPLQQSADSAAVGSLLVKLAGGKPLPVAEARRDVRPILQCIHKQLDIRLELSAVRRQTAGERRDMELLLQLDQLAEMPDRQVALQKALRVSGERFESDLAVMWMPARGIRKAWRRDGWVQDQDCDVLEPIFTRLLSAAKRRRRVLNADTPRALQRFAGSTLPEPKILCSPILDDSDEVAGLLALVGARHSNRDDIRLTRVISARLASIAGTDTERQRSEFTRHDLLRLIDRQLDEDPNRSRALLLVDIDKLHVINEMHGHFGGDAAIKAVLAETASAGGPDGVVCDMTSGAIALFLPDCDDTRALQAANAIRAGVADRETSFEGRGIDIAVSIGIAMCPAIVQDAAAALNTAEVAVRSAKARGGDQSVVFDDLDASVMRRREDLDQVGQLQSALLDDRFILYGQQIVALNGDDDRPRFEVLLRMIDEDGQTLSPNRFLSAAERYQMMTSIDRWVVRKVTDMLSQAENPLEINLASFSVNVSTQSIMDDEFPNFVENCILDSGIAPDTFCFEITETSVMRNPQRAQDLLQRFARLGCRVALDDFGTGQCSFAYLKDLPVQYIKIDGAFVRDVATNPLSAAIVESVSRIAGVINARTIGEFVENDLIYEQLRDMGIDFAQGYKVGRPMPLEGILGQFGGPMISTAAFSPGVA